jgi:Rap1a immunity proteins
MGTIAKTTIAPNLFEQDRGVAYIGWYALCIDIPQGVTLEQMTRVVVAYIDKRPERMHEYFTDLALQALQFVWPCN